MLVFETAKSSDLSKMDNISKSGIPKLDLDNYHTWSVQVKCWLVTKDLYKHTQATVEACRPRQRCESTGLHWHDTDGAAPAHILGMRHGKGRLGCVRQAIPKQEPSQTSAVEVGAVSLPKGQRRAACQILCACQIPQVPAAVRGVDVGRERAMPVRPECPGNLVLAPSKGGKDLEHQSARERRHASATTVASLVT